MILLPATSADYPYLFQLYEDTMRPHIEKIWGWDDVWQRQNFQDGLLLAPPCVIYDEASVVGYFQVESRTTSYHLRMILLTKAARSQGLGAVLLRHILQTCHDYGRKMTLSCFKINTSAKHFYDKNGWIVTDEDEIFWDMENLSYPIAQTLPSNDGFYNALCHLTHK